MDWTFNFGILVILAVSAFTFYMQFEDEITKEAVTMDSTLLIIWMSLAGVVLI